MKNRNIENVKLNSNKIKNWKIIIFYLIFVISFFVFPKFMLIVLAIYLVITIILSMVASLFLEKNTNNRLSKFKMFLFTFWFLPFLILLKAVCVNVFSMDEENFVKKFNLTNLSQKYEKLVTEKDRKLLKPNYVSSKEVKEKIQDLNKIRSKMKKKPKSKK